jgi:uncharacterized protein (DUF2267 family)
MSEQGLETIEATVQKRTSGLRESPNQCTRKNRCLEVSAIKTLRDRLPIDLAVHFGAQLPMLIRGLYYEGREPSKVPIKMSREEFLAVVQSRIIADRVFDPVETGLNVLAIVGNHVGNGEMRKIMDGFPREMQSFFPALASAA